jgi:hypothetical protein
MGSGPGQISVPRGAQVPSGRPSQPNVDRSSFQPQINDPAIVEKIVWMVNGEVGRNAPLEAKIVQTETLFNRAQKRGDTIKSALRAVHTGEPGGRAGPYYAGYNAPGGGTYGAKNRPTPQEIEAFKRDVLAKVMAGSNLSDVGWGPMTGNASAGVAAHQFAKGTHGYKMRGGDTYFLEDRGPLPTIRGGPSSIPPEATSTPHPARQGPPDLAGDFSPSLMQLASNNIMTPRLKSHEQRQMELERSERGHRPTSRRDPRGYEPIYNPGEGYDYGDQYVVGGGARG